MSVGFTVMGFLVYSVSLYVGLSVAWSAKLFFRLYQNQNTSILQAMKIAANTIGRLKGV